MLAGFLLTQRKIDPQNSPCSDSLLNLDAIHGCNFSPSLFNCIRATS